jgi:hypothetical protein
MKLSLKFACAIIITAVLQPLFGQKKETPESTSAFSSETFSGLKLRSIGPSVTSGRVSDLAVNPSNTSEYYVATSSGGVWKTTNKGVTYSPIFDGQGSYSIGCVTLDPSNASSVWVGSGENNSQRSVAYGDGIYKSDDGGKSWKNMGLKNSEHISEIIIHPTNPNIVYVGAYGPVWNEGGDRGVYTSQLMEVLAGPMLNQLALIPVVMIWLWIPEIRKYCMQLFISACARCLVTLVGVLNRHYINLPMVEQPGKNWKAVCLVVN